MGVVADVFKGVTGAVTSILGLTPETPEAPEAPKPPPAPSDEEVAREQQDAAYQQLKKRGRAANVLSLAQGGGLQADNPTTASKSLIG
jgi:hypothetical protein